MTGNNVITICQAEMAAALQHYFEKVLFRADACPRVESVKQTSGMDSSFEVKVKEKGSSSYSRQ